MSATDSLSAASRGNLIDATATGQLLGVPPSWVLAEARRDRNPHVRLGRYVRFEPAELEARWRAQMRGTVVRCPLTLTLRDKLLT